MVKQTQSSACPVHGRPTRRSECSTCNAAYMRVYMQQRRRCNPDKELWKRARARALKFDLPFSLEPKEIIIPTRCPAIGIPLIIGGRRTANSPSLDRIVPSRGCPINARAIVPQMAIRLITIITHDSTERRQSSAQRLTAGIILRGLIVSYPATWAAWTHTSTSSANASAPNGVSLGCRRKDWRTRQDSIAAMWAGSSEANTT